MLIKIRYPNYCINEFDNVLYALQDVFFIMNSCKQSVFYFKMADLNRDSAEENENVSSPT